VGRPQRKHPGRPSDPSRPSVGLTARKDTPANDTGLARCGRRPGRRGPIGPPAPVARTVWMLKEAKIMPRWEGFQQCPGCGLDIATGEGQRGCAWGDCPYLPEELDVYCPYCRFDLLKNERRRSFA